MKYFGYAANLELAAVFNKNVMEISNYYLHIIEELKLSQRLNTEDKIGQLAFLVREWGSELNNI